MRGSRLLSAAAAVCLLWRGGPALGATTRASLALEYDDNPFQQNPSRQTAWVSRLYLYLVSSLVERDWGTVVLQHQWGLKRFWQAEASSGGQGDVLASHVDLGGSVRLHPRLELEWGGDLKAKTAQRLSSEESYLRGGLRLGLTGQVRERWSARLELAQTGDDARDERLVDTRLREVVAGIDYRQERSLSVRLSYRRNWLAIERPALSADPQGGQPVALAATQEDRGQEWAVEAQHYGGGLVQAAYSYLSNASNSLGYAYTAHTLRLVLTRSLVAGIDGQVYATGQRRRYDHPPAGGSGVSPAELQDRYEQALLALKLARPVGAGCDLSCEYRLSRNGSLQETGYFRKNVFTLGLDMGI